MTEHSSYASNLRMSSKWSAEDFVLDGNLDKKEWRHVERVRFDHDALGKMKYPESETQVASLWTAKHLYLAYWCKYTTLNIYEGEDSAKERWELWNRDVVEAFVNPDPARFNHYYEFEVSPNNLWIDLEIDLDKNPFNDGLWDSHFEHSTRTDERSHIWMCEMRIPFGSMGVRTPEPGAEWRLNLYRADGPGDDSKRRFMSWGLLPTAKLTFHQPASFGIIQFVK